MVSLDRVLLKVPLLSVLVSYNLSPGWSLPIKEPEPACVFTTWCSLESSQINDSLHSIDTRGLTLQQCLSSCNIKTCRSVTYVEGSPSSCRFYTHTRDQFTTIRQSGSTVYWYLCGSEKCDKTSSDPEPETSAKPRVEPEATPEQASGTMTTLILHMIMFVLIGCGLGVFMLILICCAYTVCPGYMMCTDKFFNGCCQFWCENNACCDICDCSGPVDDIISCRLLFCSCMIVFGCLSCLCKHIVTCCKTLAINYFYRQNGVEPPVKAIEQLCTLNFIQELDVNTHHFSVIKDLVDSTWIYEKRAGRDATGLFHQQITIKSILRIHNRKLHAYYDAITPITQGHDYRLFNRKNCLTHKFMKSNGVTGNHSDELYLFHGTALESTSGIVSNGFDMNFAKNGLFGKSIYMTDSSEKADQYSDKEYRRMENLSIILSRVRVGRVYKHEGQDMTGIPDITSNTEYDSVVAGHGRRFKEFLIYDSQRILPEYVIIYDRI